jgi:hypothetical protein
VQCYVFCVSFPRRLKKKENSVKISCPEVLVVLLQGKGVGSAGFSWSLKGLYRG